METIGSTICLGLACWVCGVEIANCVLGFGFTQRAQYPLIKEYA